MTQEQEQSQSLIQRAGRTAAILMGCVVGVALTYFGALYMLGSR